jgi:hypothetical protein
LIDFKEENGFLNFTVRVVPRAAKSEIVGESDGSLKIRIAALPVEGAANIELIKLLAKTLEVAKSNIEIRKGATSRNKQIRICGAKPEIIERLKSSLTATL